MGLVDGTGEARCVHHSSNNHDKDNAGTGQPDVTFLHSSSFEAVRIAPCKPDALREHAGGFIG
jgi:hypothetical protein